VVELDGSQHAVQVDVDRARTALLTQHGYRVLRFWNSEVLEDMEAVLQQIAAAMEGPHPGPLPSSGEGEEIPSPSLGGRQE
jgi:very-short-patch-repair endonuclease